MIDHSVPLVDEDKETGLQLYCHVKTSNDDASWMSTARGVVFEKDSDDVYMIGVPYCKEYHDEEDYGKHLKPYYDYDIYDSHEGTIIRVFFYKTKWYTSTHRKLDAFKSKWASLRTSFGESFAYHMRKLLPSVAEAEETGGDKDYLNAVYETYFDRDHRYIFLLKSSADERIVCKAVEKDAILHVATISEGRLDYDAVLPPFPKPAKHPRIETPAELDSLLFSINPNDLQGVLLIDKQTGEHIKIYTRHYKTLFDARNNVPSIRFRYYQLLAAGDTDTLHRLKQMYPEVDFRKIQNDLEKACIYLYHKYIARYVYKETFIMDPACHYVLCKAHEMYKEDHKPIVVQKIKSIVAKSPTLMNKVVKCYKKMIYDISSVYNDAAASTAPRCRATKPKATPLTLP